jgi:glycosyltransferase involved in cell wall biosynthesis
VIRTENGGVSRARNLGAERANADVIAFLDADDMWLPGKLRRQMIYLEQHCSVAAVFCELQHWFAIRGEDGLDAWSIPDSWRSAKNNSYRVRRLRYIDLLCGDHRGHLGALLIRSAVFASLGGFDERRRFAEDHELFIRASQAHIIDILEFPGLLYRQHADSATHKLPQANALAEVIVEAIGRYGFGSYGNAAANQLAVERRLATSHFAHGHVHFWFGSLAAAKRELWQACKYRLNIRSLAYLVTALTPGGRGLARLLKKMIRH